MGALERIGRRIVETVEDRTGREIVPRERMEILEAGMVDGRASQKMLDWIAFQLTNRQFSHTSVGRMPSDMHPIARVAAAAQAQRAWIEDPMAGQQVDLYVSFLLGRGVPRAIAHDDEVQNRLDAVWKDRANQRVLTGFAPLVEKAIDLALQSNVYFLFFDGGQDGMVRASLLTFDDVLDVVRHPKDKYRILYYKAVERTVVYDYAAGQYVAPAGEQGAPKTVYYEAWGAFDDDNPVMVAQDEQAGGRAALELPAAMMRPGKVVHLAVNKTSEMAFGVPRMRRLLRWFTAYNETLESHVNRMKAMASVYMKATVKGSQRDLDRLAEMATNRRSAFGSVADLSPPPAAAPAGQGILGQNEALNYEPFKIDSGAGDVAQSVPQLRAQASGMFPPTYYGQDAGSLAGQQTVELPVLKFIERDQETVRGLFRTLGDATIKAAIAVGDLDEWRVPTAAEMAQIEATEEAGEPPPFEVGPDGRIKRDLSFEISLPSPLKRAMGDLVSAAAETATAVDPNGQNPEMSRWLFGFILSEAFDVDDPQRIVDQVLPHHLASTLAGGGVDPATGQPRVAPADDVATVTGPDGKQHPPGNAEGARQQAPNPEDRRVTEAPVSHGRRRAALAASRARRRAVAEAFDDDVAAVAAEHLARLGDVPALAATNGNGTH